MPETTNRKRSALAGIATFVALCLMASMALGQADRLRDGHTYSLGYTLALWALLVGWAFETHQTHKVEMHGTPA